jgi:aminopeptidase N
VTRELAASRIFCCFDQPDLRAPFTVSVQAPGGWSCRANAPLAGRPAAGDAGLWRFATTTALPPSLFSVCAGPFSGQVLACERDRGPSLPVTLWALPPADALFDPETILELVRQPLRYYERTLGVPYPYGKCDLVFVPGFPALAFSAPGLITAQDTVLQARERQRAHYLAAVIAHELAHAWFGGLVGMRQRDDAWLIEAITTYLSRAALAETRPGTTPWAAATSATLPDHAYAGNAAAIRQLETLIGRQAVMLGLGSLLHRHPHSAATKDDLVQCWSQATGRDLRTWAAETLIPAPRPEDHSTG